MTGPLYQAFELTGAHPWLYQSFVNEMWQKFPGESLDDFLDWVWAKTLAEGWAP